MILAAMPGLVLRGVLFALLACSLLVNPVAPPAAFYEGDDTPFEDADEEGTAAERIDGGSVSLSSASAVDVEQRSSGAPDA